MIRLIITSMFLTLVSCLAAQQGNPFEINNSVISVDSINDQVNVDEDLGNPVVTGLSDNPFDIRYRKTQPLEAASIEGTNNIAPVRENHPGPSKGLVLIYTVVSLILLSVAIAFNRSRFAIILGSLVNGNNLKTLHRGNKPWSDVQSLFLYGIFFLNVAFFTWLLGSRLFQGQFPSFFYLIIGVLTIYLVRHLCLLIVSDVYSLGPTVDQFNYSIALHNMVIGVVLLPFILSLGYVADQNVKILSIGLGVIVGIVYLLRQSKGILSAVGIRGFNPFYFFIYLCAFEITPILMAWKVIGGAL